MAERTLIIFKPDALQRRLVGEILSRFEKKGLQLVAARMARIERAKAEEHYAPHRGKPFFPGLVEFITRQPVVLAVLEGPQAIAVVRKLLGATFGFQAEPGTIRGDYGVSKSFNLIHGSDSPEAAAREIGLFFRAEEIHAWQPADAGWIVHPDDLPKP